MSVYYNITKLNKDKKPERFIVNESSFDAVLANQSLYEVGVKRFKIPATEIDLYRIYPNRNVLGASIITSSENKTSKFWISDLFNNSAYLENDYDAEENSYYMPITSHKHFAQLLTRTLYNCFNDSIDRVGGATLSPTSGNLANIGASVQTGVFIGATGGLSNNINQALTWSSAPTKITPTTTIPRTNTKHMRRVVAWELDIVTLTLTDGANDIPLEDLTFTVYNSHIDEIGTTAVVPTMKDVACVVLKGLCKGKKVSDFATIFPNGLRVSSYGTLRQSGRSDYPPQYQPNLMPSEDCDLTGIMGTLGEFSTWEMGVGDRNKTTAPAPPNITIRAVLNIVNSNAGTFTMNGETGNGPFGAIVDNYNQNINQLLPLFDVASADNRLQFNTLFSYLQYGLKIYTNNGLSNLIGFDNQPTTENVIGDFEYDTGSILDNGVNLNLNGSILQFTMPTVSAGDMFETKHIACIEPELSVFKRNFVYGIAITANSFSIDGEYEGNGSATRKILSDYEIDPSTNFRDYYIYQPSGDSVRYYQMNSTSDLRDIFVSVFYRDMNGNYKPLEIGQGYLGSIKIHFRPVKNY
tara:strand:+ start:1440 stop:3179 length:1740 start_codon:yes stop_codon:yes gene_type:complete